MFGNNFAGITVWRDLLEDIFHKQESLQVNNQITFALDTLPVEGPARVEMLQLAGMYFGHARLYNARSFQVHFTVNCVNDLKEYVNNLKLGILKGIDLVSVSNINKASEIAEIKSLVPEAQVNWNVLSSSIVKKDISTIKEILTRVDSMYLLLHKAPMGHRGHNISDFYRAIQEVNKLDTSNEPAPENACKIPSITDKIMTDGCISDSRKYIKSGFGCSSNISRFQIWPDGRVTGCAYNSHNQYGKAAVSLSDIVDNLRNARTRYEFSECSIPIELQSFNDGKKHLAIV